MENGDAWLAIDKLHHILFCFFISLAVSLLASKTRYPFIRRRSIWVGSVASFAAGAAKEFADEMGYFKSAGASTKDAVADIAGILLAAAVLYSCNYKFYTSRDKHDGPGHARIAEMAWNIQTSTDAQLKRNLLNKSLPLLLTGVALQLSEASNLEVSYSHTGEHGNTHSLWHA